MKIKDFDKLINETFETCKELMIIKGGEYANGEDRLDNFKKIAANINLTSEEVWRVYLGKHLDAIDTYTKDIRNELDRPRSESILGRFDDAINYLILGKALVIERSKKEK